MKKFYAILLGLALTLGIASVASAAFAISGQFVVEAEGYFDEYETVLVGPYYDSGTRFEVKLTGAYGDFSGDATFRFTFGSGAAFRSGKIMWAASDEVKLGVVSSDAGTAYYASPVDGDELKYDFMSSDVEIEDWVWCTTHLVYDGTLVLASEYDAFAKAELVFGDFKADVFVNGLYDKDDFWGESWSNLWIFGDLEYAMDPITFYLPFDFEFTSIVIDEPGTPDWFDDVDVTRFYMNLTPAVKYAISDEFYVAAELGLEYWTQELVGYYDDEADDILTFVGIGADYAGDALHAYGSFDWDFAAEEVSFWLVGVEYNITDAVMLYAEVTDGWDDGDSILLGLEWNMDGAEKVMLVVEAETDFEFNYLDILATWTFKM